MKSKKNPELNSEKIKQYTHEDRKRKNNPPVGLVTPKTDPDQPTKKYAFDPRLDPQLTWSGKSENSEFDVDTVSLHVHERIDPITILEKAMKPKQTTQETLFNFFEMSENNPPLREAIDFYKHEQNWTNRLIAGDSLLVMNSLLEKEGMEGKVQMIYIDPPYGIKYGSNFQPFVNKKEVADGKDEDLTQEPEMIKAFRDTWELGIHSYLTYLRDRLLLAKKLLTETGSCFVQIGIENLGIAKCVIDEIFGRENFVNIITYRTTSGDTTSLLPTTSDYIVWIAKSKKKLKFHKLFLDKKLEDWIKRGYDSIEDKEGNIRKMTEQEKTNPKIIPNTCRIFQSFPLKRIGFSKTATIDFPYKGKTYHPGNNYQWRTNIEGLNKLKELKYLLTTENSLRYKAYLDNFPITELTNVWVDTQGAVNKRYVVQTSVKVLQRCMLLCTDPGDLVFDPTCGSGTTAFLAEKWGRRWITCDTSRVSISIAKQRLMIAIYDYYKLKDSKMGIIGGFLYKQVPHVSLRSIVNEEQNPTETLYDKPDQDKHKVRITGPFTVEAVPSPIVKSLDILHDDFEQHDILNRQMTHQQQWRDELLKTGIRGKGGQKIEFSKVEIHPATRWLHVNAETKEDIPKKVMVSFGPEHAPLEQRQVALAIDEAQTLVPKPKIIIFAAMQFDPEAAKDIDELNWPEITILKVEMNKDLLTQDLKKKRSSNESFWLMGQPDVEIQNKDGKYVIVVNGFDYYNTNTGEIESGGSSKIAMWMLDTDYDGRSVYPQQVFFPMESKSDGWGKLAKTLQAQIDAELIVKYQGTESIPFEIGPNKRAAVKIIDDRGIESLKIIQLEHV